MNGMAGVDVKCTFCGETNIVILHEAQKRATCTCPNCLTTYEIEVEYEPMLMAYRVTRKGGQDEEYE